MRLHSSKRATLLVFLALAFTSAWAQTGGLTVRLSSPPAPGKKLRPDFQDVVAWLEPIGNRSYLKDLKPTRARLVQKGKQFHPHLQVLPAGSSVEFPNEDPLFHNVFSLFNGKRFDLGLYEAGESRTVRFDRVGVSYIFCNIHPQMSAVIVTVDTPYYAVSNADGVISLANVPSGDYELHIFAEGLSSEAQRALVKRVSFPSSGTVVNVTLPERETTLDHKNKYGREYDPAHADPYEK